ncbi:MAG TPA: hypothetical protein VF255_10960 [Solirubrobacterales bacterium]
MRFATCLLIVAAAVLAGCGDSGNELTAEPAGGAGALERRVRLAWERNPNCERPQGTSRWGCSVGPYRCQGVVTGRGWSISCSRPGRSLGFTVPRG